MTHDFFWFAYLSTHQKRATRILHYIATAQISLALILCLLTKTIWLLFIAVCLFAALTTFSHSCIENNPGMFRSHPFRSLLACFRMSFCALTGDITADLKKAGAGHPPENW